MVGGWLLAGIANVAAAAAEPEDRTPASSEPAKREPPRSENWPVTLSLLSESFGFYPAHPHFVGALGTEFVYVRRRHYDLVHMAEFGYLHHAHVFHGPYLDTGLMNRFKTRFGLYGELGLKAGFGWLRYPGSTYVFDADHGEFVEGGNRGIVTFRVTPSAILGFDLRVVSRVPIKLFARYDQVVLFPFWKQEAPLLGQSVIGGGISVSTNPAAWRREP